MNVARLKIPPHSGDAEQSGIGAALSDPACIGLVTLQESDFYRRENRTLWGAILRLSAIGQPVDALTVMESLSSSGILEEAGGIDYIASLSGTSMANVRHYAAIVRDRALERRLISAAHAIADMGFNGEESAQEKIGKATSMVGDLASADSGEPQNIDLCMREAVTELERRHELKGQLLGVSTGFRDLDKRTQGLSPGDLIIVAGRPSMGKSTLAQNFIEHAALAGKNILFFSVEMPEEMVAIRHLSSLGKAPLENLVQARIKDLGEELVNAAAKMRNRLYHIDDTPHPPE